jgi:myo-inositol-1(or 4)-monophosphatase
VLAAREAGPIVLRRPKAVETKSVSRDLVSEVDRRAEERIRRRLRQAYPEIPVVGEEGESNAPKGGLCWYVDPLDGTVNHVHGVPQFSVSIACAEDGRVVAGAIYDPSRDEMFSAARGHGAFVNRRRLQVSKTRALAEALLGSGFPYDRTGPNNNVDRFTKMLQLCHGVRRLGSACLDLAYVAAGRFDGYWELTLNAWDFAAGILLVEEAGGRVSAVDGSPLTLQSNAVLASNGPLHAELVQQLSSVVAK